MRHQMTPAQRAANPLLVPAPPHPRTGEAEYRFVRDTSGSYTADSIREIASTIRADAARTDNADHAAAYRAMADDMLTALSPVQSFSVAAE